MPSESIQVRMGLDARPFQAGLTKSKAAAMQFQQGLNKLGMGVGVLGLVALAKKAADAAAELKRTGEAVGLTVEEVQSLGFAASQNGSSINEMNKALTRLSVNLGKANAGEAEAIRKFEDYGIAIRDAEEIYSPRPMCSIRLPTAFRRLVAVQTPRQSHLNCSASLALD